MYTIHVFRTQDGEWYTSNKPFSIPATALAKYKEYAWLLGGAHHVYVRAPAGKLVTITSEDGQHRHSEYAAEGKWINMPLSRGFIYYPDQGQRGFCKVLVDGKAVADGIGLPYALHVSTIVDVQMGDEPSVPTVPDPPSPPPAQSEQYVRMVVETVRDSKVIKREVVWQSK